MADIERIIMDDIASDPAIRATDLGIELKKKGLFKKTITIHMFGAVATEEEKSLVIRLVERHAGDNFFVNTDELNVHPKKK